jgi:hypothetical protein
MSDVFASIYEEFCQVFDSNGLTAIFNLSGKMILYNVWEDKAELRSVM